LACINKIQQIAKFGQKFIDVKIAISGAIVMGGIVFSINYSATHKLTGLMTVAFKQRRILSSLAEF